MNMASPLVLSNAKECTETNNPDLTKNVPSNDKMNTDIADNIIIL